MPKFANQRTVELAVRVPRNKDNIYATINIEALQEAMKNIKGETLKLWLYINKNQDKYKFDLSQKALEEWGLKKDSYYTAVGKLIELGYLEITENNKLIFYETLPKDKEKVDSEKQKSVFGKSEFTF